MKNLSAPRQAFKRTALSLALAVSVIGAPMQAHAAFGGVEVVAAIENFARSYIGNQFSSLLGGLTDTFSKVGSAIQSEVNKSAIAQKNTAEGIASWEAQERLRMAAARARENLEQPATTCTSIAAANSTSSADINARSMAAAATQQAIYGRATGLRNLDGTVSKPADSVQYVADNQRAILNNHEYVRKNFCTAEDQKRDPSCQVSVTNPELAGGDFNAMLLFQGTDLTDTYTSKQDLAVDAYIRRITNVLPPELLRDPIWEKTPQGKAYVELTRRYSSFISMPTFSLQQIKANHMAKQGLGDDTLTSSKTGKHDISMMEAISLYVSSKFSAESIKDLADSVSPNKILRDIAQTGSYRVWIEFQQLRQAERMEAMLAAQLSLMTEQHMKAQITAQGRAASAARGQ